MIFTNSITSSAYYAQIWKESEKIGEEWRNYGQCDVLENGLQEKLFQPWGKRRCLHSAAEIALLRIERGYTQLRPPVTSSSSNRAPLFVWDPKPVEMLITAQNGRSYFLGFCFSFKIYSLSLSAEYRAVHTVPRISVWFNYCNYSKLWSD